MSNFTVPDGKINRNPQAATKLDNNVRRGFETAVRNGQLRLALEYMVYVLDILDTRLGSVESPQLELGPAEEAGPPQAVDAPAKAVAKKKTVSASGELEGESITV